jgi:hypothetical protein
MKNSDLINKNLFEKFNQNEGRQRKKTVSEFLWKRKEGR